MVSLGALGILNLEGSLSSPFLILIPFFASGSWLLRPDLYIIAMYTIALFLNFSLEDFS